MSNYEHGPAVCRKFYMQVTWKIYGGLRARAHSSIQTTVSLRSAGGETGKIAFLDRTVPL